MTESSTKTVAKNTGYLYLRMILVMGVSLFTSRVILRTLGFEDFGIYNVVGSVVVFLSFLQAALRNASFRYLTYELGTGNEVSMRRVYSMAINSHALLALILLVIMEVGGVWFLNNKLNIAGDRLIAANWVYQFSLIVFCLTIIRTPYESNILAHEKMDFYAVTSIVEVVLKLLVVYMLTLLPLDKLITYSFLLMLVALILTGWYMLYCKQKFQDTQYERCWDKGVLKQFVGYSGWSLLVNGACITRSQCISIFFNMFMGVLANAALGIANQVISVLNTFVTNFTQAFKPQLIKSWASQEYDYFMKLIYSTSKISYFLLLLISVPVVVNIDFALKVWLGDYPPMAAVYVESIILYYLVDALQEPLVSSVHATGNLKFHQIMVSIIVFAFIPVSYIMLKLGCSGETVLVANAVTNIICAVGRTIYMRRLINLDLGLYFKKVICPTCIVTILSLPIPLIMKYYMVETWGSVILNSVVSVAILCVLCLIIGLDKSEKQLLYSIPLVKKILRK